MKSLLFLIAVISVLKVSAQKEYVSSNSIYRFAAPESFVLQQTANQGNEFILINNELKTSLLIKVNKTTMTEDAIVKFKNAADSIIEKSFFTFVPNPNIIKRGEVERYKNNSIIFHVEHSAQLQGENKYLVNYIFYHKGNEINFIFRTDKERLSEASSIIEGIIASVILQ